MEYHYIIALCLGLISIIISVRYMTVTTNMYNEIKYIRSKCMLINKHGKISNMILNIQKNHGLSLKDIKNILLVRNSSREDYKNFTYYDTKHRNMYDKDKIILDTKIKKLSHPHVYKYTLDYINSLDKKELDKNNNRTKFKLNYDF
uniref:Uncharacterized protein n=1 Tax=viral metagenome TaxID=1070528 RepID=A0A6C0EJ78_9ZZZZ